MVNTASRQNLVFEIEKTLENAGHEERIILEGAIARIKNIGYVSDIFKKGATVDIQPAPEMIINKKNIWGSLSEVVRKERDRGYRVCLGPCILDNPLLKGRTMPAIEKNLQATIHRFKRTLNHRNILEEAGKVAVIKYFKIEEAWNAIIAGVLAGEVDIRDESIFAHFMLKQGNKDIPFYFEATRSNFNGNLNIQLDKVGSLKKWNIDSMTWGAGSGVILSD